ncbi:hypothetical protein SAMN05444000_103250 [Shimia gijangensis]|uniref:Uncharacterized protein n=1 Tax=Shimia gijangensis TaxID=1470563 RepID=A0A1M6EN48_9RHOB|nr:hypothetical protein [Shimia gijangensis]SHI86866.1 hypothetical protein SAMN05444000_103250 [Shimia gijangensis]
MPVSFRILKSRGLVFVKYEGEARFDDTAQAFAEYAQHPDCRPGQKQLVDLSGITSMEKNFTKLMQLQAQKADVFAGNNAETLIVYYAPNPEGLGIAQMILKSWEPFDSVVPIVLDDEAESLAILGLKEASLSELLTSA